MPLVRPPTGGSGLLLRPSHTYTAAARSTKRSFTQSTARRSGAEQHYDPPTGWLWGVPAGQKYKKEGWEGIMFWGFGGSLVAATVAYVYKPDTRYVGGWAWERVMQGGMC
jgi:hypothetical protein